MTYFLSVELFLAVKAILEVSTRIAAIKHLWGAEGPVMFGLKAAKMVVDAIEAGSYHYEDRHGKRVVRVVIPDGTPMPPCGICGSYTCNHW